MPLKTDFSKMHCSIARTLDLVGECWSLLIIRDALGGKRRFDEFQASLGIATNVLAARLKRLTDAGILQQTRYQRHPVRYEYQLTEKGRALSPILFSLMQWGDRFNPDPKGPSRALVHRPCGHRATLKVVCPDCGEGVKPQDFSLVDRSSK